MKILFVLENYYPNIGGVETLFKNLVEHLVKEGHQVTVITTRPDDQAPKKEIKGSLKIYRIPFPNRYFFTFFGIFPILRHIRQYDIVHTTSYNAGVPAFFAAKLFRKKIIITFHEAWSHLWFDLPYMGNFAKWLHYLFEQFLLKLPFNQFVGVSQSTADNLEKNGISKNKISVIYNGINYTEFENIKMGKKPSHPFTYTYFGRLGMSKGLDILLEAAVILKKKLPNSRLQMIIPKVPLPLYNAVMDFVHQHELQHYIIFKHNLPFSQLQQELKQSDCVVIPSYSEGFCFAAVEAIALGVPVISSDKMALKEVVSGQFIKMEELSTLALVKAIEQAEKGQWEQTPVKKFHLATTIQKYLRLYKKILN